MIPFYLLFFPARVLEAYPIRYWRTITLWLKWGILFSLGGLMVHIATLDDPSSASFIFSMLEYLAEQNRAVSFPFLAQFGLFFIFEILIVLLTWVIKGSLIYLGYRMLRPRFGDPSVAMSVAGASMVTNIWLMIPFIGFYAAMIHGTVLIAYLVDRVNRTDDWDALKVAIIPGFIPLLY